MTVTYLYQKANEELLTSSESVFKAHMQEFYDHKIVLIKKSDEGDMLYIPLDKQGLETMLESITSSS